MKKTVFFWQFIGFIFTSLAGVVLHFLYEWTGENILIAPFSAVNESIWEHMKLLYFPMLVFALAESRYLKDDYDNFWCAKLAGFSLGLTLIPISYYTYTGVFGVSADWLNIIIFFIAAAAAYILETKILQEGNKCVISSKASRLIIILIGILFVVLTFVPIQIPLFKDPQSLLYGINS